MIGAEGLGIERAVRVRLRTHAPAADPPREITMSGPACPRRREWCAISPHTSCASAAGGAGRAGARGGEGGGGSMCRAGAACCAPWSTPCASSCRPALGGGAAKQTGACWRRGRALTGRCRACCCVWPPESSSAPWADHDTAFEELEARASCALSRPLALPAGGAGSLLGGLPPALALALHLRLLLGRGGSCECALALTTGSTRTPWATTKRLPPCSVHFSSVIGTSALCCSCRAEQTA